MCLMHSKSTRHIFILLVAILTFGGETTFSQESDFQYFSKGIDFWNERADLPAPSKTVADELTAVKTQAPRAEIPKKEGFQWDTYMDPKNREFFKEGDYTPPEPFMELVRDPTDQNMKMWFAYMDKKNELSTRLQQKMAEYVAKNGQSVPQEDKQRVAALSPPPKHLDPQRYRFRMYFNSTCPHCQRMFGTLSELQANGFFVEARQIDREHGVVRALPFPAEFASSDEAKQKNIQNVPLLLVGDLKKKVVYRLNGYQTTTEVLKAIQSQDGGM